MTELPKGANLTLEDLPGPAVLVVCSGVIGLQHHLSDGRRSLSELFMRGDIVDSRALDKAFECDVVALGNARFCTFQDKAFEEVCHSNPRFSRAYSARIREQSHVLRDHCIDIGKKTPPERIASFLLEQLNRGNGWAKGSQTFRLELTYIAVGDYLALQPETVSRTISRLSREGLISVRRDGRITIVNESELSRIANGGMPRRGKGARESAGLVRSVGG